MQGCSYIFIYIMSVQQNLCTACYFGFLSKERKEEKQKEGSKEKRKDEVNE